MFTTLVSVSPPVSPLEHALTPPPWLFLSVFLLGAPDAACVSTGPLPDLSWALFPYPSTPSSVLHIPLLLFYECAMIPVSS